MKILFLANRPAPNTQAATVTEYLDALHNFSRHQVYEISMLHHFPARIDLDRFDAVITHYSLSIGPLLRHYLGPDLVAKLKAYKGLKAAFLQDEYREIGTYWKHINELGLDVLFSCVPEHEIPKVYPPERVPNLRVVNVLTGYVPEALIECDVAPVAERPIDIGYRTRKMPYWLGRLGYEKWMIADEFARRAANTDLVLDLSYKEGERFYGEAWTAFVASTKAVLGCESGASIIDFDGQLERRVEDYIARYPEATYDDVHDRFLIPYEGSLELHQLSPRCFEAAALRTPMVLFEGNYSGILKPDRHYIPLKKDFSNFDEVVARLHDHQGLQEIADRTYREVALDPRLGYPAFIAKVDDTIEQEVESRQTRRTDESYSAGQFRKDLQLSINYYVRRKLSLFFQSILLGMPMFRRTLFHFWALLPRSLRQFVRPYVRMISR
jgi:hypothetical protein